MRSTSSEIATTSRKSSRELWPAGAYYSYVKRVHFAGGFRAYEKEHLAALVATFAPKFSHLPKELVGVVMMFYAHVGFYYTSPSTVTI